jgi:hypothetical protein
MFSSNPAGWVKFYDAQLQPYWYDYLNHVSLQASPDDTPVGHAELHSRAISDNEKRSKFSIPSSIKISFKAEPRSSL